MEEEIMKIIVDLLKSKKIRFETHNRYDDCLVVYFDSSVGYIQIDDDEINFYSELEEYGYGENLYYSNLTFSSINTLIIELDKFILGMNNINDVLNHIDNFQTIIDKFRLKYPEYKYKINLNKNKDEWIVEITIINEKQENINTFKKTVQSCSVL